MRFLYLDTSAAVKLFREEEESAALEHWLVQQVPDRQITSHLTRTELRRSLQSAEASEATRNRADHWLDRCAQVGLPAVVYDRAGTLGPGSRLRSLDAIHVAAALELGPAVSHFVTYDKRQAAVAATQGIKVVAPA